MCLPSNGLVVFNTKGTHRFEFITRQQGSHMWRRTRSGPAVKRSVRALIKPSSWTRTSAAWTCVFVCDRGAAASSLRQHSHVSSSVLQRRGAPAQVWVHLLLLFSTDNWLEQWNACPPPSPLKLYTLFILEVSFLLPLSLFLSNLHHSLLPPSLTLLSLTLHPRSVLLVFRQR